MIPRPQNFAFTLFFREERLAWEVSKQPRLSRRTSAQKEDCRGCDTSAILWITLALVGRVEGSASDRKRGSGHQSDPRDAWAWLRSLSALRTAGMPQASLLLALNPVTGSGLSNFIPTMTQKKHET